MYNLLITTLCSLLLSTCIHAYKFDLISLHDVMLQHPDVTYLKCHDVQSFDYEPFPASILPKLQPNKGLFAETFVVNIPNGQVASTYGWVLFNNKVIQEFISQDQPLEPQRELFDQKILPSIKKISGKVVVLTRIDYNCFGHWMHDIMARLALLEMHDIEYDWIYVTNHKKYMKETLAIWGIDPKKIIEPFDEFAYIQADELIVPSLPFRRIPEPNTLFSPWSPLANYFPTWIIEYLRSKCLPAAEKIADKYTFSKRIFISRKDTNLRNMINEDEVFSLFEPYGFKRYCLGQMSILEQVLLFKDAEIIIAAHGSGLTNLIFCKEGTRLIEIFQARSDCSYWYSSQTLGLDYHYILTMPFKFDCFAPDSTTVSIPLIQNFIEKNAQLFE